MLNLYRNITYLFAGILVLAFLGFYKTYFGLFPSFNGLPVMAHVHAIAFLLWFGLLIAQPLLIRFKKIKIHRVLGRASYFLVPVIAFTIIGMARYEYLNDLKDSTRAEALSDMRQTFIDLFFFVGFYLIAMIYRKKLSVHISFIIACSLILLSPGLGRLIFFSFHTGTASAVTVYSVEFATLIFLMVRERIKLQKPLTQSPYLLIIFLFIAKHVLYWTIGYTTAWQWTADKIARHLFW